MTTSAVSPTGSAGFGVIAERFRRAGQPEKAVTLCREGLDAFPDHLSARVTLGWALLDLGEYQEAFGELKAVLKRAPDNLAAIRGLAELHERGVSLDHESFAAMEADIDPELPEVPMPEAVVSEPVVAEPVMAAPMPAAMAIEDVFPDADADADAEADVLAADLDLADLAGLFGDDLDPIVEPAFDPIVEARPVSSFERAPLALRDEVDDARVERLHRWLTEVRERRVETMAQYDMAG